MRICSANLVAILVFGVWMAGCETGPLPSAPSSAQRPPSPQPSVEPRNAELVAFPDGSGLFTSDARDSEDEVVQFTQGGELVWAADGRRIPGYRVRTHVFERGPWSFVEGELCPEKCELEIRWGLKDGEKRAYLTADYGHDNPGTLVDLEIVGDRVVATRTSIFPPGTFTQSGVISEVTAAGLVPLQGVLLYRAMTTGYQSAVTDAKGFYRILGMYNGTSSVYASKDGYQSETRRVTIAGDTRFDLQMIRQ